MWAGAYGGWLGALTMLVSFFVLAAIALVGVLYLPWIVTALLLTVVVVVTLVILRRREDRREAPDDRFPA